MPVTVLRNAGDQRTGSETCQTRGLVGLMRRVPRLSPMARWGEGHGRHAFFWERRVYGCSDAFRSGTTARALVSY
jgi:hypothetical protein